MSYKPVRCDPVLDGPTLLAMPILQEEVQLLGLSEEGEQERPTGRRCLCSDSQES